MRRREQREEEEEKEEEEEEAGKRYERDAKKLHSSDTSRDRNLSWSFNDLLGAIISL